MTISVRWIFCSAVLILSTVIGASVRVHAETPTDVARLEVLLARGDTNGIKALGPDVLPTLAQLYRSGNITRRTSLARVFYALGWRSPEAKAALMQDAHTPDESLRIEVQYALGRVSNDADVVDVLLDNMMHDRNLLLRDKAACALAYDQIHLTEKQKVRLYEGLITALSDSKPDVRKIAILALSIQTGQTKGYDPNAWFWNRSAAIHTWQQWLDEYRSRW